MTRLSMPALAARHGCAALAGVRMRRLVVLATVVIAIGAVTAVVLQSIGYAPVSVRN